MNDSDSSAPFDTETAVISETTTGAGVESVDLGVLGSRLGRYVVLEPIGRGGMGRVLRAYDAKLQREVALKQVLDSRIDTHSRDRILREARAMAQLSHPNVVAVYDVEETELGFVLVMEYVLGQTLRQWTRSSRHSRAELIARYVDAGRGLAAAHSGGLLHRDFKPANVLVAESGAVKVTDFGLAKLTYAQSVEPSDGLQGPSSDSLDSSLTRTGEVMGTPRYMPPEQHRGERLTAAADQYAFCVALWEALVGRPPYVGSALDELQAEKQRGAPTWPSSEGDVPASSIDALRRGLAPSPGDRWPSMDRLLDVLMPDPVRRRSHWLLTLGAAGVTGAVALAGGAQLTVRAERCTGASEQLVGVWDAVRRAEVEAALLQPEISYTRGVWERVDTALEGYATQWVELHTDACEATTIRAEQSPEMMDLRMGCLHRAKVELEAVVDVLARPDQEVARKAFDVVRGLEPLDRCADVEALGVQIDPPRAEEVEAVEAIRARVARGRAELKAGHLDDALRALEDAREGLADVEYGPVRTEVAQQQSFVLEELGHFDESEAMLREALRSAAKWRQWESMQQTASRMMVVLGFRLHRVAEASSYWDLALGLANGDPRLEAKAHTCFGTVLEADGKYAESEEHYRHAMELRAGVLRPDHPDLALSYGNLGIALGRQGKFTEAEAWHRRSVELWQRAVGAKHPEVAAARNNLSSCLGAQGKQEEAEAEIRIALELREESLGVDHPDTLMSRSNLAIVLERQGRHEDAEKEHRRVLAARERVLGSEHPDAASSHNGLGNVLVSRGETAAAEVEFRSALKVFEATLGDDHPHVAGVRYNLANTLRDQGEYHEAEPLYRRALVVMEQALEPENLFLAMLRRDYGSVLLERGEVESAYTLVQGAWSRLQHDEVARDEWPATVFLLARASWRARPEERAQALSLAERALADYERAGPAGQERAAEVRTWLAARSEDR